MTELKVKISVLEGQLAAANEEKSRAVAELEQRMTADRVKQQVCCACRITH